MKLLTVTPLITGFLWSHITDGVLWICWSHLLSFGVTAWSSPNYYHCCFLMGAAHTSLRSAVSSWTVCITGLSCLSVQPFPITCCVFSRQSSLLSASGASWKDNLPKAHPLLILHLHLHLLLWDILLAVYCWQTYYRCNSRYFCVTEDHGWHTLLALSLFFLAVFLFNWCFFVFLTFGWNRQINTMSFWMSAASISFLGS